MNKRLGNSRPTNKTLHLLSASQPKITYRSVTNLNVKILEAIQIGYARAIEISEFILNKESEYRRL